MSGRVSGPALDPEMLQLPEAISRSRRVSANSVIGLIGLAIVVGLALMAIFADQLSPYDPIERVARPFLRPSGDHLLGTNDIGQDLVSELIHGARISLTVGVVAALVSLLIGTTVGLLAGFYPRRLGRVLMRGVDIILVLPVPAAAHHPGRVPGPKPPDHDHRDRGSQLGWSRAGDPIAGPLADRA